MAGNDLSEEQLFNRLANQVVGHWYRFDEDEVLIFSLALAPASLTDVTIILKGIHYPGLYRLGFLPNWMAYVTINQLFFRYERIIEVITKDTMILKDKGGRLIIYERRADQAFAEAVIDSAHKEREEP